MGIWAGVGGDADVISPVTFHEPVASYAALSAVVNPQDGDWCKTGDDGRPWRALVLAGNIIWVPPDWYDAADVYVLNASGDAYINPADAFAALTARGWVDSSAAGGTATKSADAPLILDSGSGANGAARLDFTPTTAPTTSFHVAKIKAHTGVSDATKSLGFYALIGGLFGGTQYYSFASFSWLVRGDCKFANHPPAQLGNGLVSGGSDFFWVFVWQNCDSAQATSTMMIPNKDEIACIDRSEALVGHSLLLFTAFAGSDGVQRIGHIEEWHWIKVA